MIGGRKEQIEVDALTLGRGGMVHGVDIVRTALVRLHILAHTANGTHQPEADSRLAASAAGRGNEKFRFFQVS